MIFTADFDNYFFERCISSDSGQKWYFTWLSLFIDVFRVRGSQVMGGESEKDFNLAPVVENLIRSLVGYGCRVRSSWNKLSGF